MNFLFGFIGIGIAFIGRAVYVAQKIKKDPETKKYGDNPKKALSVMALAGSVLFAVGCIGFPVLDALKPTVYTFVNNSSFPVTVMPEYGDDFQIQSKTTKSFESKHKDMQLSYTPAGYVQVEKNKPGAWEFTNGDYYLSEERGFLIYPPEGWTITDFPGLKYKAIFGEPENDFTPNINFSEENNPFSQFNNFLNVSLNHLRDNGNKIVSRERFFTDNGLEGFRAETNTETLLQIFYIFNLGQTVFFVTCSAPLQSEIGYGAIFDKSVGTLNFLY